MIVRRSRILDALADAGPYALTVVALGISVVVCSGCPARPAVTTGANECAPNASRCSPGDDSRPEICSPSHRWYRTAAEPCAEGTQCCLASSDDGPPIHACVPARACVPESLAPAAGAPADPPAQPVSAQPSEPARDPFAGEDGGT